MLIILAKVLYLYQTTKLLTENHEAMDFKTIEKYIQKLEYTVVHHSEESGVFVIENPLDGIHNLIVGIAPPVLIFEQYLFTIGTETMEMYRSLLRKNRDMIHGAFAVTEDGSKVIFRYTLQIHNLNFNEFEAAISSLSLMLSEYYEQLIEFSKL